MNLCIDIQSAVTQRAGVGRYTRCLVEHLPLAMDASDRLKVFYFDFQRKGQPLHHDRIEERAIRWVPGRFVQNSWKRLNFPPFDWLAGSADLYHFPNFVRPPLTRGRSVVTIHDVSFLRFPETTEKKNLAFLRSRIRQTVRKADAIITDSRFSADEIVECLGADPERIHAVHLGLSMGLFAPSPATRMDLLMKMGLERPYLLCVGTLEPRKNYPFLVEVFEALDDYDGDLVIAGMPGWKFDPILERFRNSPRAGRIRYLEYVGDDQLAALYGGADLFVFPSIYEGFGFPPLEAMMNNAPVVSSTAGSLPEVLGDAACLIDGYDVQVWAEQIRRLLGDSGAQERLRKRGREKAASYTWEKTAQETLDVYRKVLA